MTTIRSEAQRQILRLVSKRGLTHRQVADAVGWPRPTITNLLNGNRLPGVELAAAFEDAFGIAARLWAKKARGA